MGISRVAHKFVDSGDRGGSLPIDRPEGGGTGRYRYVWFFYCKVGFTNLRRRTVFHEDKILYSVVFSLPAMTRFLCLGRPGVVFIVKKLLQAG